MSNKVTRLQGPEWYAKKDSLIMTAYKINEKGHVKGQYIDMDGNLYSHWFSDNEIEELTATEMSIKHRNDIQFGIPTMSDLDIEKSIDNVLSREELIKQMNDFVLEDEKERYVRALLNRLNNIIDYCENRWKVIHDAGYNVEDFMGYIVKLAKGDTNE